MIHTIREIGPKHIFLGTDSGKDVSDHEKSALLRPIDAYRDLLERLVCGGFTDEGIGIMSTENPKKIIRDL